MRQLGYLSAVFFAGLFSTSALTLSPAELRELVRESLRRQEANEQNFAGRPVLRRIDKQQFDGNGKPKSREIMTVRQDTVDGVRTGWVVERNDKPVSEAARKEIESAVRKGIDEARRKGTVSTFNNDMTWLRELPDALDFKLEGTEEREGRETLVIEFQPRPVYRPKSSRARVFEKSRGRIWIDRAERQAVGVDAEVFDTVSVGWGLLARIEKGTRFTLEQARLEDQTWAPKRQVIDFDLTVMLFKHIHNRIETQIRLLPKGSGGRILFAAD